VAEVAQMIMIPRVEFAFSAHLLFWSYQASGSGPCSLLRAQERRVMGIPAREWECTPYLGCPHALLFQKTAGTPPVHPRAEPGTVRIVVYAAKPQLLRQDNADLSVSSYFLPNHVAGGLTARI
jgi:hypothetical protein